MGAPINVDVRRAAVRTYASGVGSYGFVATLFAVGIASVKRWVRQDRETGSVEPELQKHGPEPKIDERGLEVLKAAYEERPDMSLVEVRDLYNEQARDPVSVSTIGRAVRELLDLRRKKKSYRPEQQDTPRVQKLRSEFAEQVTQALNEGWRLVFVDESGCRLGMDRLYGRAEPGQRVHCAQPYHRGPNINIVGAIGVTSVRAAVTVDGSVNGDVMETFARDLLGPKLRADDVVIWDNLSAHKQQRVVDAIEARGAKVLPMPPYSPDLNPIELMWAKMKSVIRRFAPRTVSQFHRALRKALLAVTRADLRNWFRHCLPVAKPA